MIRIAAAGDIHFDRNSAGRLRSHFHHLEKNADIFILAGDLTQTGHPDEVEILAEELRSCPVPIFAVLGNHDVHLNQVETLRRLLSEAHVTLLEKEAVQINIGSITVGIAGLKGFGGGFVGACASEFGEVAMKDFIRHTKDQAQALRNCLESLDTKYKIALLHYSPIKDTLLGEKKEIYPFLGSYLLAEAVDLAGADIIFHGHAHRGIEKGATPNGIPVRNVAQPVIRHAFNIYTLNKEGVHHHASVAYRRTGTKPAH
jgi:Icc-related predicted phosphoesterase